MSNILENISGSMYLCPENSEFFKNGDIPGLRLKTDKDGEKTYGKVILVKSFPFLYDTRYITVLDTDMREIGIIEDISIFPDEVKVILSNELSRRYRMPEITKVIKVTEKMNYTNMTVIADGEELKISIRDIHKNMIHLPHGRCIITDADGNRYEIKSLNELDKSSKKKLELII